MAQGLTIKVDDIARAITTTLEEFRGATQAAVDRAVEETAKATVDTLRETSPRQPGGGSYAESWTADKKQMSRAAKRAGMTVYNKQPQMTRWLEKGHRIMRDNKQIGSARARVHIAPAEARAAEMIVEILRREIEK